MTRRPPTGDDDDTQTAIFDGRGGVRPVKPTQRGVASHARGGSEDVAEAERRRAVELATPTEITPERRDRSEPIRVISMKQPEAPRPEPAGHTPELVRPKLRALSDITPVGGTPMGRLAPPRDPKQVRARRLRDGLIWGSAVLLVGAIVMLAIWLLARR